MKITYSEHVLHGHILVLSCYVNEVYRGQNEAIASNLNGNYFHTYSR